MRVKNINGTSGNICKCGSWIAHWERFSGQALPQYCPETNCIGSPEVGAHVQRDDSNDQSWYIVPLCKKHNGLKGESITISDHVKLASANVKNTCGRE